jgi:hypothetical protein
MEGLILISAHIIVRMTNYWVQSCLHYFSIVEFKGMLSLIGQSTRGNCDRKNSSLFQSALCKYRRVIDADTEHGRLHRTNIYFN